MLAWTKPVALVNGRIVTADGAARSLRFTSTILSIDDAPRRGDAVIDLDGAFVIPGLINAHDHLELNHYGSLTRRGRYENASDWIGDLDPVIHADPEIRRKMSFPLGARLLAGAVKNVLAGVTTVAHHNPRYREIGRKFPVRVVEKYGWAHSFALEGKRVGANGELGARVAEACAATPAGRPFIVHAGEGIDARALHELEKLESLNWLRENTVVVHGVAMTPDLWRRASARGASLVWCPASNLFLFGRTLPVRELLDAAPESRARISVGTDSRLTGSRDLLEELRVARSASGLTPEQLLYAVTEAPARALKLDGAGRIAVGQPADLLVLGPLGPTAADTVLAAQRRHIEMVAIGGRPAFVKPAWRSMLFARRVRGRPIQVDGVERIADSRLVAALAASPIPEAGVTCA